MIETIFHPSDFSETSQIAFAHSLKLALAFHAELRLLHVSAESHHGHGYAFPEIRESLERWGIMASGSHRSAVKKLGIDIDKVVVHSSNVVSAVTQFLAKHSASLVVLATHRSQHKQLWFGHSKAEPIARKAASATLFVPDDVDGFVSLQDGVVRLRKVLIPIAITPSPLTAFHFIHSIVESLHCENVQIHAVHFGTSGSLPSIPHDPESKIIVDIRPPSSDLVEAILAHSQEIDADLIVMPTQGHHGFLDILRGNTTEQVLRSAECPVLAITST